MEWFKKFFGIGFIASIAGIELTNIIVFSRLGLLYGVYSFILIVLAILPLIYLQQVVSIPYIMSKNDLHNGLVVLSKKLHSIYLYSIYFASILTIVVNIIGLSMVYSYVLGSKWIYYSILFIVIVWAISINKLFELKTIRVLTILSITLVVVYIILLINNLPYIMSSSLEYKSISFIDMLALWGAVAAPYSLYMQVIETNNSSSDLRDIYVGGLFNIVIGIAIASTPYAVNSLNNYSLEHVIGPFRVMGFLSITSYMIGLTSSVLLASLSIEYVVSDILSLSNRLYRYSVRGLLNYLLLSLIVVTIACYSILGFGDTSLLVDLIVYGSAIIGLLFTITLTTITIFYISNYRKAYFYRANTLFLVPVNIITLYIAVVSVLETFY